MEQNNSRSFHTSESVSDGHPDKLADQISDSVLDHILTQDREARVACETLIKSDLIVLAGEITSSAKCNFIDIAQSVIKKTGYDHQDKGLDYRKIKLLTAITQQSPDISIGVNEGTGVYHELGAGDQGIMYGYACDDNDHYLPNPIYYAHKLLKKLKELKAKYSWIYPDAKSQVTIATDKNHTQCSCIVLSTQHAKNIDQSTITEFIIDEVIKKVMPYELIKNTTYFINPTGTFVVGGPVSDAGLTGRKLMVDTYGGLGAHGGGAFSGKDPTKVDRSGAYMARYISKNIVSSGLAKKCLVKIAYAIGKSRPVSIHVDTYSTSKFNDHQMVKIIKDNFALTPKEIISTLDLKRPIYLDTSSYGHFGGLKYPWEQLNHQDKLKNYL